MNICLSPGKCYQMVNKILKLLDPFRIGTTVMLLFFLEHWAGVCRWKVGKVMSVKLLIKMSEAASQTHSVLPSVMNKDPSSSQKFSGSCLKIFCHWLSQVDSDLHREVILTELAIEWSFQRLPHPASAVSC